MFGSRPERKVKNDLLMYLIRECIVKQLINPYFGGKTHGGMNPNALWEEN
jgi:hypothetical protein